MIDITASPARGSGWPPIRAESTRLSRLAGAQADQARAWLDRHLPALDAEAQRARARLRSRMRCCTSTRDRTICGSRPVGACGCSIGRMSPSVRMSSTSPRSCRASRPRADRSRSSAWTGTLGHRGPRRNTPGVGCGHRRLLRRVRVEATDPRRATCAEHSASTVAGEPCLVRANARARRAVLAGGCSGLSFRPVRGPDA